MLRDKDKLTEAKQEIKVCQGSIVPAQKATYVFDSQQVVLLAVNSRGPEGKAVSLQYPPQCAEVDITLASAHKDSTFNLPLLIKIFNVSSMGMQGNLIILSSLGFNPCKTK